MSIFSDYFHNLRRRHKISQKELGALTGYGQAFISSMEVGRRSPTNQDFIEKLILVLNLDAKEEAELRQAVAESQRYYTLPDDISDEISRMVSTLWSKLGDLNQTQIRGITEILEMRAPEARSTNI